jgi:hypothetical protein
MVRGSGSELEDFEPGLTYQPTVPATQTSTMAVKLKRNDLREEIWRRRRLFRAALESFESMNGVAGERCVPST